MTLKEGKREALRGHFLASGSSFLVALEGDCFGVVFFFGGEAKRAGGLSEALAPGRKVS